MNISKFLLILYAATTGIFVDIIGRLMLAELLAVIMLPFINVGKLLRQYKGLKIVLGSLVVLLLMQILSDFVNNSSPSDYLRGWAAIIFTIISIIFLVSYLSKNNTNIIYYLLTLMFIRLVFGEGDLDLGIMEDDTNYFKVRFVGFLNFAIMLFGYYLYKKGKIQLVSLSFLFYGLFSMSMDARSNGVIFIISGILVYIKTTRIRLSRLRVLIFSILLSGTLYVGYVYYVNQVIYNNFGGSNAKTQLNKTTNPYNPFELIYYGRSEFIILAYAGLDKPIFGHGSWGKDPNGKYALLTQYLMENKYVEYTDYIRAHSIMLGYFAYAGILGLLPILFLFFKLFSYAVKIYKADFKISTLPIVIVLSLMMLWDFFFSPIGALRTTFPLCSSLLIIEYTRYELYKSQVLKGY